jgi:hypothetical protein
MKGLLKCEVLVGYLEWSVRLHKLQGCWKACVSAPARFGWPEVVLFVFRV